MDTIYALASAQGKAGVAVLRVSGPKAREAAMRLCGRVPAPRRASLHRLTEKDGALIDKALVVFFESGASFTGEESVEFHLHGSRAIIASVMRELSLLESFRLADPGEFTRRALENGRMDLTEVEGLADLIDAETEAQRRLALRIFGGALGEKVASWRERLLGSMSLLAVTIDFSDEDVPEDVTEDVRSMVDSVLSDIQSEVSGISAAERVRDGFEVAIIGPPNIGKSTLLNTLAGREAALTSEIAGTTRDVIEVRIDLDGLPVTFLDTAGLRETEDFVENLGIQRAVQRAELADLRVFLTDGSAQEQIQPYGSDIVVVGKSDLVADEVGISGKTGQGVGALLARISAALHEIASQAGVATQERHRIAMTRALENLERASELIALGPETTELAAEELRQAVSALDVLVGKIDVEDLLDSIFKNFCLGK